MRRLLGVLFTCATAFSAQAQEEEDALLATQALLKSPSQRQQTIQEDERARSADAYVQKISGGDPAKSQEVYNLSADVLADVVKQSGGDAKKMQALIEQAGKDPAAFLQSLSPEQQAKVRDLAGKMEDPTPRP